MKTRWQLMAVSGGTLLMASLFLQAEELTLDGVTYHEVRWGALTPASVSIIHARGIETVPLEKLPPELQRRFHYDPVRAAQYRTREEAREIARLPALDRAAVVGAVSPPRPGTSAPPMNSGRAQQGAPTRPPDLELTGFLVKTGEPFLENGHRQEGALLELAKPRGTLPANPLYHLRIGLWERTGEFVFLKGFTTDTEPGLLVRLRAVPAGEVRGLRAFTVTAPKAEQEPTEETGGANAMVR